MTARTGRPRFGPALYEREGQPGGRGRHHPPHCPVRQDLTDEQAVEVMVRLVRCLAEGEREDPDAPPGA